MIAWRIYFLSLYVVCVEDFLCELHKSLALLNFGLSHGLQLVLPDMVHRLSLLLPLPPQQPPTLSTHCSMLVMRMWSLGSHSFHGGCGGGRCRA